MATGRRLRHKLRWTLALATLAVPVEYAAADLTLDQATEWLMTGRYAEAIEACEALDADDPVLAAIVHVRGLRETGRVDQAWEILQQRVKAIPTPELFAELADLAWSRGDVAAAADYVSQCHQLDPQNITAWGVRAELARTSGDLQAATRHYQRILDIAADEQDPDESTPAARRLDDRFRWIGRATAQLARWNRQPQVFKTLVNRFYPRVLETHPTQWQAHLAAGQLFLEKFNQDEATREFAAARRINPHAPQLLAATAQLALLNHEVESALLLIRHAQRINPDSLPAAVAEADAALVLGDVELAATVLERSLSFNPRYEPTLARLAACYRLIDGPDSELPGGRMAELVDRVRAMNPNCGEFYSELAAALEKRQRFVLAARYFTAALEAMPQLIGPRAQLGLMNMRLGDEDAARRLFEEAFRLDPFNVRVKNSLEVLEVLAGYATLETDHFLVRYDPQLDPALGPAAAEYLEQIYPELCRRLDWQPAQKTLVEFFNRARNTDGHAWFSARIIGLPRVHTIGACAGKMVAMTSPAALENQTFNWAQVLRHELVHVINLEQTKFSIPRWFTEGLAVYLEDAPRQYDWNVMLARRVPQGNAFDLRLDRHGLRPS